MTITDISQLDLTRQYSYADYLTWQIEERIELINGHATPIISPNITHQIVQMQLVGEMGFYFKKQDYRFLVAPVDVCLVRKNTADIAIKTVVQPDLLVICDMEKIKTNRHVLGAPDLVVEILSPGNSRKEMKEKFEVYEENGVREYWIVSPVEKNIAVFYLNENNKFIGLRPVADNEFLTSTIFPDLQVDLNEVFKNV